MPPLTLADRARLNALKMLKNTMRDDEWQAIIEDVMNEHPLFQLMRDHMVDAV